MIFTTTETFLYYTSLVRNQRRDWFLGAMFLSPSVREAVIAIYALDIELEHVHHVVKEEMMGHIRYAWWFEKLEALSDTMVVQEHPLLQAIASSNIPKELLISIVSAYRDNFPELPPAISETVQSVVEKHLINISQSRKWKKASAIIAKHRKKHGSQRSNLLLLKLLFV